MNVHKTKNHVINLAILLLLTSSTLLLPSRTLTLETSGWMATTNELTVPEAPDAAQIQRINQLVLDGVTSFAKGFKQPKNFKSFFSTSTPDQVPPTPDHLNNLELTSLEGINDLPQIHSALYINVSSNLLTSFEFLPELQCLSKLYANENELTTLDKDMPKLKKLESLYLNGNRIKEFNWLSRLPKLKNLFLRNNELNVLPIFPAASSLTSLDLSKNQLSNMQSLDQLTNLNTLNLEYNNLQNYDSIPSLPLLISLYLAHNQINRLCDIDFLTRFPRLTYVTLQYNQIKNVPEEQTEELRTFAHTVRHIDFDCNQNELNHKTRLLFAAIKKQEETYLGDCIRNSVQRINTLTVAPAN